MIASHHEQTPTLFCYFRFPSKRKGWQGRQSFEGETFSCSGPKDRGDCVKISSARNEELSKVFWIANSKQTNKHRLNFSSSFFRLIKDGRVEVSNELRDLYSEYQQEIHASTYTSGAPSTQSRIVYDMKLPPIYKRT